MAVLKKSPLFVLVVQWTEQGPSKPLMQVRFLPGTKGSGYWGDRSSIGRALGCGPSGWRFETARSPHMFVTYPSVRNGGVFIYKNSLIK